MKYLLSLALILISFGCALSQIALGVQGGVNVNAFQKRSFNNENFYAPFFSTAMESGVHFGFFAQLPLSKKLSIIPEARYIQRGAAKGENSEKVELRHLDFPLSLQYRAFKRFAFDIGGVYSSTLAGTIGPWESKEAFKPHTFAGQGGISFFVTKSLSVKASYYQAFDPVLVQTFYNPDNTVIAYDKYYNTSVQLSLKYSIISLQRTRKTETETDKS